jgi:hypothetical protein
MLLPLAPPPCIGDCRIKDTAGDGMLNSRADSGFLFLIQAWLCTVPMFNFISVPYFKKKKGSGRKTVTKKEKNTRTGERGEEKEQEDAKKRK